MPSKIEKGTLSQTAVAIGILTDKIRLLRAQGLDPDPDTELCRLLGKHPSQLPERLELKPGDKIPALLFDNSLQLVYETKLPIDPAPPEPIPKTQSEQYEDQAPNPTERPMRTPL